MKLGGNQKRTGRDHCPGGIGKPWKARRKEDTLSKETTPLVEKELWGSEESGGKERRPSSYSFIERGEKGEADSLMESKG